MGVSLANDMNKNTYEVKMDNKKVAFQLNESIFQLSGPTVNLRAED